MGPEEGLRRDSDMKEIRSQILRKSPFKLILTLIYAGILMHCCLCRPSPAHHRAGGPRQVWIQILRKSPFKLIIALIHAGILMHCCYCRPSPRPPQCWRPSSSLDSTSGGATLSTQRCEAESYTDRKEN